MSGLTQAREGTHCTPCCALLAAGEHKRQTYSWAFLKPELLYILHSHLWLKMKWKESKVLQFSCLLWRNSCWQAPKDFPLRYFVSLGFFRNSPDVIISWYLKPRHRGSRTHSETHPQAWQLTHHRHVPSPGEAKNACRTNLWMRLVRGSISFFPSLGSNGVRAPNY